MESVLARHSSFHLDGGTYLEKRIELHENAGMLSSEDENMPTKNRERVETGKNAEGKPLYEWACGRTLKEKHDSIVRIYVDHNLVESLVFPAGGDATVADEDGRQGAITFQAYASEWLDLYKAPKLKPTALRGYKTILNSLFYPAFGGLPIGSITTAMIQSFLNERVHLARKYLDDMLILLGEIFADAIEDGCLKKNPTVSRKLTNPSNKKKERQALTKEQILSVLGQLEKLEEQEKRLVSLLLLTGMRRGEVLGLRWEDIDADVGLIHVRRNVTYAKNQPHIGTPKTKRGEREVPLDSKLWSLLQPAQEAGYIFGGDKPLTLMVFRRCWQRIEKQIDMFGATPHIFRHSYLTLANNAGVDI